jgi:hypothetical protein
MKFPTRTLFSLSFALLAVLAAIRPAAATTFQMMSDRDLTDQASAVIQAKVVGVEPAPVQGKPSTDYLVEVERVLKGDLPGSTVVVRVPGGVGPNGVGLKIWGAPELIEGERALLFLVPMEDGTYRILHLMLGAFRERVVGRSRVALRDLSEAHEVGAAGEVREGGADLVRGFDRFADWIADRAAGYKRQTDYVLGSAESKGLGSVSQPFSLIASERGIGIRWFVFDRGESVPWRVNTAGQPGLGLGATVDAFKVAIKAWVDDPSSNVLYTYAGTTTSTTGLTRFDSINSILFDDPYRDDPEEAVEGSFICGSGGVIAIGGPFFFLDTRNYNGKAYHEAAGADIVTNDGTECFFRDNPRAAEEVFAHELGHTLGLGHSTSSSDALMWSRAHNNGRGARLAADDRAGIASLYGRPGGSTGGAPPATPKKLTGRAVSGTEVVLNWRDKARNEDVFRIEQKVGGGYREIRTVPANSLTARISGLKPGTSYTFRVRAANGAGNSGASNAVTVKTSARRGR